jgi:hypothetical protein
VQDHPGEAGNSGKEGSPDRFLPHQVDVAEHRVEVQRDVDRPVSDDLVGNVDAVGGLDIAGLGNHCVREVSAFAERCESFPPTSRAASIAPAGNSDARGPGARSPPPLGLGSAPGSPRQSGRFEPIRGMRHKHCRFTAIDESTRLSALALRSPFEGEE